MHVLVHVCFNPESRNLWIKYTSLTVQYSFRVWVYPPTLTCFDILFNSLKILLLPLSRFIPAVWRVFMHNVSLVAISRDIYLTGLTVLISVRFFFWFSSDVFSGCRVLLCLFYTNLLFTFTPMFQSTAGFAQSLLQ